MQLEELKDSRDERRGGWHWLADCHTGVQPKQDIQHGPAETSYVTASATEGVSENTVEMEDARKSPTRDLYPVRQPSSIPGYMVATQSARAKARIKPVRIGGARWCFDNVDSELRLEHEPQWWQRRLRQR